MLVFTFWNNELNARKLLVSMEIHRSNKCVCNPDYLKVLLGQVDCFYCNSVVLY